jgi:demethylmenaquinone methyltransferase/2-methoxy-6-polyprenyl-1,4-benzoquinol methylase
MRDQFGLISKNYNFINSLITGGFIYLWRNQLKTLQNQKILHALNLAAGTGADIPYIRGEHIHSVDVDKRMLECFDKKYHSLIRVAACAEKIPYSDEYFDTIICSFGIRNFSDLKKSLGEISRVLKQEGCLFLIEIFKPEGKTLSFILKMYFQVFVIPLTKIISPLPSMYKYFCESIFNFLTFREFLVLMQNIGFYLEKHYSWGSVKIAKFRKIRTLNPASETTTF